MPEDLSTLNNQVSEKPGMTFARILKKISFRDIFTHLVMLGFVIFVTYPVWLTIVGSTYTDQQMATGEIPPWFGENYSLYFKALSINEGGQFQASMLRMLGNSLILAIGFALGKVIVPTMAAFALVFMDLPFKKTIFTLIICTLFVPFESRMVPTYIVMSELSLLDTYTGLILPVIASASGLFLMRQFFLSIPTSLGEAARIDGATPLQFLWMIVIPLSKGMMIALFIIMFIAGWNQYLWPVMMTTDPQMSTLMVGIKGAIQAESETGMQLALTLSTLALVIPLIIVIRMQKQIIKGFIDTEK